MDPFFAELGRTVLERWEREGFALATFPEIARVALDARPPSAHVDVPAFVREFLLNDQQAPQTQSGFGQPELVVYGHPRFYIQVLFWLDGTTDIHQHGFSGAFHVLAGSSIHARFELANAEEIAPHFRVGDIRMRTIELLESGRTVAIVAGDGFIHSLFHLETPSITVVVRTHHDPGTDPQLNYLPPRVALDPTHDDALLTRRRQLLDVLEEIDDPTHPELVLQMLAEMDFARGFVVLQSCMAHLRRLDAWAMVLAAFEKKHGPLATGIAATLEGVARRDVIVGLRSAITDPEHRFFLALLLTVSTRDDLLAFVARRFPAEPPAATVLRWAEELLDESEVGPTILDACFPEALEVAPEVQPEVFLAALRYFVETETNVPAALRSLPTHEIAQLRNAFAQSSLRVLLA